MRVDRYKFGQKNNWRRWIWNQISMRVHNKRNAVVLYLAGLEDLDRSIAIQHGFHPNNLIAIDRNRDVVLALRKKGCVAINGNALDIIFGFSKRNIISVLHLDFCSGIVSETADLAALLYYSDYLKLFKHNSIVAFNFLRGRDKENLYSLERDFLKKFLPDFSTKHRGYYFFVKYINHIMNSFSLKLKTQLPSLKNAFPILKQFSDGDIYKNYTQTLFDSCMPSHFSYKSSKNIMDSIVFNLFYVGDSYLQSDVNYIKNIADEKYKQTYRDVNAALAIRFMRDNGHLKLSPSF